MLRQVKNLLARAKRLEEKTGTPPINYERLKNTTAPSRLARIEKTLDRKKGIQKTNERLKKKASELGITIPERKTLKGLELQQERLKQAAKNQGNFKRQQQKILDRIQKYNANLSMAKASLRFNRLPTNKKELNLYNKALENLEKGNVDAAKNLLGVKKDEEIRKVLSKKPVPKNQPNYRQLLYLKNAQTAAKNSALPQLAELFKRGGVDLLEELASFDFKIVDFYDVDTDQDDIALSLLDQLQSLSNRLTSKNRQIVQSFVSKWRPVYE